MNYVYLRCCDIYRCLSRFLLLLYTVYFLYTFYFTQINICIFFSHTIVCMFSLFVCSLLRQVIAFIGIMAEVIREE